MSPSRTSVCCRASGRRPSSCWVPSVVSQSSYTSLYPCWSSPYYSTLPSSITSDAIYSRKTSMTESLPSSEGSVTAMRMLIRETDRQANKCDDRDDWVSAYLRTFGYSTAWEWIYKHTLLTTESSIIFEGFIRLVSTRDGPASGKV